MEIYHYNNIFKGGKRSPPRGLPDAYTKGFKGCIEDVFVDDEKLHLVDDRRSHGAVEFCDGH